MSILPLILKNGVNTYPRSVSDMEALKASMGIGTSSFVDVSSNQTIAGIKTFTGSLRLPSSEGSLAGHIWRSGDALLYRDGANVNKTILNSAGNLSNLADKQISLNNLVNGQVANRVLRSDGTNVTLSQVNLANDTIGTLPINLGGTGNNTQNFVDLTTAQTIAGIKTFSSPLRITNSTPSTSTTTGALVASGGLGVTGDIYLTGKVVQSINHTFRAAASAFQAVPNAAFTKINLGSVVNDSNSQYNSSLSRLTAITTEVWRISVFITYNLTASGRILLTIYKNNVETLRILDLAASAGFLGGPFMTIPEITLNAGEYLELFTYTSPGQTVYGDNTLGTAYWFGKRIN